MELYNTDSGKPVRAKRAEVSAIEAYPPGFRVSEAQFALMGRYQSYSGPPLPLAVSPNSGGMIYDLEKFFRLPAPGRYTLKLWPKIYESTGPGADICKRVDLPVVTAEFQVPSSNNGHVGWFRDTYEDIVHVFAVSMVDSLEACIPGQCSRTQSGQ
jgi:hypothetical protein